MLEHKPSLPTGMRLGRLLSKSAHCQPSLTQHSILPSPVPVQRENISLFWKQQNHLRFHSLVPIPTTASRSSSPVNQKFWTRYNRRMVVPDVQRTKSLYLTAASAFLLL